ncbi:MAG: DUF1015 family protein [Tatlockia sp.]|nr:DUF1015 family protein [Tatlockia sp.]
MKEIIYPLSTEDSDLRQEPSSYILCEMSSKTGVSQGLLAFISIDSVIQNRILKNEKTYPKKQHKILGSFLSEKIQKKPILLTYDRQFEDLNFFKKSEPDVVFCSEEITYRLWQITDHDKVRRLSAHLNAIDQFVVADGHHRLAAITQYYLNKSGINKPKFLAFIMEKNEISLQGFNKLLTGLNLSNQQLIEKMSNYFNINKLEKFEGFTLEKPAIYLEKNWFVFSLKNELKTSAHLTISANYVHCFLIEKILGITSNEIEEKVISINHDLSYKFLEQSVNNGRYQSALFIPSIKGDEFINHIQSGYLFPQNTTYFSPKINHDLFSFFLQKQIMGLDLQKIESVA